MDDRGQLRLVKVCIPSRLGVHVFDTSVGPGRTRTTSRTFRTTTFVSSEEMPQGSCPGADNSSRGLTRPLRRSRCCAFVEGRPRTGRSARARGVPGSERQLGSHGTRSRDPAPPELDCKTSEYPVFSRPARCRHSDPSRLGADRRPRARPEPRLLILWSPRC